jgi:biotin synthase-like enzyme
MENKLNQYYTIDKDACIDQLNKLNEEYLKEEKEIIKHKKKIKEIGNRVCILQRLLNIDKEIND